MKKDLPRAHTRTKKMSANNTRDSSTSRQRIKATNYRHEPYAQPPPPSALRGTSAAADPMIDRVRRLETTVDALSFKLQMLESGLFTDIGLMKKDIEWLMAHATPDLPKELGRSYGHNNFGVLNNFGSTKTSK